MPQGENQMLSSKKRLHGPWDAAPAVTGPRIETVDAGAARAANAGRLGRGKALERRLRRQRRRARATLQGRQGWSTGLW